jgi:uncharacterized protein
MKILVTGGTGFVGSYLTGRLAGEGHSVSVLVRPGESPKPAPSITYLSGDPTQEGPWMEAVDEYDGAINLAGAPIFTKWTESQKKAIRESRILTTRNLVAAIRSDRDRPFTLISTSAVGYYGFHDNEDIFEESAPGVDFLAGVAADWEAEALTGTAKGARVVITRFGIVLGGSGGALGQMIPLFKWFVGGPIGSGKQWFSWVHMEDLARAMVFILGRNDISGPLNLCSPQPVTNRELAKALGKVLHRPSFFPAPSVAVRMVLGEFGSVVLKGQRVLPRRLLEKGFIFKYPTILEALQDVVGSQPTR